MVNIFDGWILPFWEKHSFYNVFFLFKMWNRNFQMAVALGIRACLVTAFSWVSRAKIQRICWKDIILFCLVPFSSTRVANLHTISRLLENPLNILKIKKFARIRKMTKPCPLLFALAFWSIGMSYESGVAYILRLFKVRIKTLLILNNCRHGCWFELRSMNQLLHFCP